MNQKQTGAQSQSQNKTPPRSPTLPAANTRRPSQPGLLARYAENILWIGRYMERVENQARLLEVTRSFAQEDRASQWLAILRINDDEARFRAHYPAITGTHVARFYLLDCNNPSSVAATMSQVRENARTLRALISTEMWLQINVFHSRVAALTEAAIAPHKLTMVCEMLRGAVQAHTGITDGTFYRDQSWNFYAIGRHLERADQTTRLVDIKYTELLQPDGPGSAPDAAQWDALLRAASGYHSYRRAYPRGYSPDDVAGFLLLDGAFPRSVLRNLRQLAGLLDQLRGQFGLRGGAAAQERLDGLLARLSHTPMPALVAAGLPPFLDLVQREIAGLHDDIAAGFFTAAAAR